MGHRVLITGANAPAGVSMREVLADESVSVLACDRRSSAGPRGARAIDGRARLTGAGGEFIAIHPSDSPEFIGDLVTLCANHDVDLLVPMRVSDQQAIARETKLFRELGVQVWLAPIPERATRSLARRILQFGDRASARGAMSSWLGRVSNLSQAWLHSV